MCFFLLGEKHGNRRKIFSNPPSRRHRLATVLGWKAAKAKGQRHLLVSPGAAAEPPGCLLLPAGPGLEVNVSHTLQLQRTTTTRARTSSREERVVAATFRDRNFYDFLNSACLNCDRTLSDYKRLGSGQGHPSLAPLCISFIYWTG